MRNHELQVTLFFNNNSGNWTHPYCTGEVFSRNNFSHKFEVKLKMFKFILIIKCTLNHNIISIVFS